jgi:hypothetical protein
MDKWQPVIHGLHYKYFSFDLVIFPIEINVFFNYSGEPEATLIASVIDQLFPNCDIEPACFVNSLALCTRRGHNKILIYLNGYNDKLITHGVIAHEVLHAIHYIGQNLGFKPDFDNDEHLAYIMTYIIDKIYENIDKSQVS